MYRGRSRIVYRHQGRKSLSLQCPMRTNIQKERKDDCNLLDLRGRECYGRKAVVNVPRGKQEK